MHDDFRSQAIVLLHHNTPLDGQTPPVYISVVIAQAAGILHMHGAHLTNRRHAKGNQITGRASGVALEVTVQAAVQTGQIQLVRGQGKMVQTNIDIPRIQQTLRRHQEQLQALVGVRQFFLVD